MNLGKTVRLNRIFSHSSGRLCAVAVDHFINYGLDRLPPGLRDISSTLRQIVAGGPDSVTMHRGIAQAAWKEHAGKIPFILQSTLARPDDTLHEQVVTPEDAVLLGADAFALAAFVRGPTEGQYLKAVSECVRQGQRHEMPFFVHIYPRKFKSKVEISFEPDDIAWAVRCALECGVDVIKVPYCGDLAAYTQIVKECPLPIVAAGGPQCKTALDSLVLLENVVKSGARGAVVGRNVWGFSGISGMIRAMKAVVHEGKSAAAARKLLGS